MIVDNLIYFALFAFIMMVIGLILTVLEFRHGEPHQQQAEAEKHSVSDADYKESSVGRPAR